MKTKNKKSNEKRASRGGHGSVGNSFVAATAKVQEDDYIDDDGEMARVRLWVTIWTGTVREKRT